MNNFEKIHFNIERAWKDMESRKIVKTNWLGLETTLRFILGLPDEDMDAIVKLETINEAIAAHTGRGKVILKL